MHGSVSVSTADASRRSDRLALQMLPQRGEKLLGRARDRAPPVASNERCLRSSSAWLRARVSSADSIPQAASTRRRNGRSRSGAPSQASSIASAICAERALAHHAAALERHARHSVDQRRLFVLAERRGAGLAHFEQALGTVLAHAGEDHADRRSSGDARRRTEQHVDRRPMAGDRRAVGQPAGCCDRRCDEVRGDATRARCRRGRAR